METWVTVLVTAVASVLASTGFWTFLQKRLDKNSLSNKMLVGLAHDRIVELGMIYIDRQWITNDEYENLHDYLYLPYKAMGGNGTAERVMQAVAKLEVRNVPPPTWPQIERRKNGCYSQVCDCNNSVSNLAQEGQFL